MIARLRDRIGQALCAFGIHKKSAGHNPRRCVMWQCDRPRCEVWIPVPSKLKSKPTTGATP